MAKAKAQQRQTQKQAGKQAKHKTYIKQDDPQLQHLQDVKSLLQGTVAHLSMNITPYNGVHAGKNNQHVTLAMVRLQDAEFD